ncbi:TPA: hypothetical protein PPH87_004830 [Escherichia coli]|nr:hypothetical protein AML88_23805 [Escherichia coli]HAU9392797.1 hypothetical protein [Escherichia coli]HDJ0097206.1 hypothetical protein [Escherichia coli]
MFGVIMKTKTFRFRKYKKKNVLLQMIVSRKQVILLRNIMTDSLLFCSVGFVFMNMCDSKYKLISGEGGLGADCADYLLFFVYAIALLMIILWMTVSVLYSIAEYTSQEKQGKSKVRSYLWFFIWFFVFNCAVYFSLKTINIKDIIS